MFHTMITRGAGALLLILVSACNPRTDEAVPGNGTTGTTSKAVVRRAVPVSVTTSVEPLVTPDPGAAATGAAYDAAIAAAMLPEAVPAAPFTLASSDGTDMTNYRGAAWWMGQNDPSPRQRWRFTLHFERFTSGVVVLRLDTLLMRDRQHPPFDLAGADSIAIRGLRPSEQLAARCRVVGHQSDERILGLVPNSTPELWMAPRSAWFVDTARSRIRPMKPHALACWLAADPD